MSKQRRAISVFLLWLLAACGTVCLSPEDAATKMLLEETANGMQVNNETLAVRQTLIVEDGQSIVAITFEGTRPEMGMVKCFYTYQTLQKMTGWVAANGGGFCKEKQPERQISDLEVMVAHYSGQRPGEPGYTQIYGNINNPDIVKIQVIWDDNVVTEMDVVNATMLTLRNTQLMAKTVEGLNKQGQVIYTHRLNGASTSQP